MLIEIKVPIPGESITQVLLSRRLVDDGAIVEKDTEIAEIDSDKATLSIVTEYSGKIIFLANEGDTIAVSSIVANVDTDFYVESSSQVKNNHKLDKDQKESLIEERIIASDIQVTPLAKKIMEAENVSSDEIDSYMRSRKINKEVVQSFLNKKDLNTDSVNELLRSQERSKMSPLRQKLAQRLVSVKNETAMLTTFNEIDMSSVIDIRTKYAELFKSTHGISLGYMSFFTKAASIALQKFPLVNSQIDEDEIISFNYTDIAIAVSAPKGLLVPVVRNVEKMTIPEIEMRIREYANSARENKLSLEEMQGGTFTITNGGVFGSLMSTPIINPPQSAILGMHNIMERPIALNGQVVIRPMMYIALSYDHRIIDGRESVGFLKMIKNLIENPLQMLTEGKDPFEQLLEIL